MLILPSINKAYTSPAILTKEIYEYMEIWMCFSNVLAKWDILFQCIKSNSLKKKSGGKKKTKWTNETITSSQLLKPITGAAIFKKRLSPRGTRSIISHRPEPQIQHPIPWDKEGAEDDRNRVESALNGWKNAAVVAWKIVPPSICVSPSSAALEVPRNSPTRKYSKVFILPSLEHFFFACQPGFHFWRSLTKPTAEWNLQTFEKRTSVATEGQENSFELVFIGTQSQFLEWVPAKKTRKITWCLVLI